MENFELYGLEHTLRDNKAHANALARLATILRPKVEKMIPLLVL